MAAAPGDDLVAKADAVMHRVLDGERVPRVQVDAAMAVLRRIPIGKEAPGQAAAKPSALHIHVGELRDDDPELLAELTQPPRGSSMRPHHMHDKETIHSWPLQT